MSDLGLTHIALPVCQVDRSIAFYAKYARMQVIHRRTDRTIQSDVVWLSDLTRPFIIVLIEMPQVDAPLLPIAHLGVGIESREAVDRLCQDARLDGVPTEGPNDGDATVGYWAFLQDPDGHTLEISYGQEVGFAVRQATAEKQPPDLHVSSPEVLLVRQAADAWMTGDADAFADLFLPDGEFIVPGKRWVGRAAIRKAAADFFAAGTDVKIDIRRVIVEADRACVEWHWQETECAANKRGSADDAIAIDFRDGKISRWREYIDTQSCIETEV
ncbi:SgcJ/EcaC family oxidoreductase [Altericista sp. CCNU0014]|uniref:SgcJ/EcaC family oxidoreductase n=1 Tax=Altericista sp. CCNU0014 TaxID=3082949 RepID=UPI00384AEFCA